MKENMFSDSSNQNFSSSFAGSDFAPAIINALRAPIDVPEIISKSMPCSHSFLYTPHSYAPREPPPCKIKTDSVSFIVYLTQNTNSIILP